MEISAVDGSRPVSRRRSQPADGRSGSTKGSNTVCGAKFGMISGLITLRLATVVGLVGPGP